MNKPSFKVIGEAVNPIPALTHIRTAKMHWRVQVFYNGKSQEFVIISRTAADKLVMPEVMNLLMEAATWAHFTDAECLELTEMLNNGQDLSHQTIAYHITRYGREVEHKLQALGLLDNAARTA